jgi:membrane protein YqaA with SNARE-associated domain
MTLVLAVAAAVGLATGVGVGSALFPLLNAEAYALAAAAARPWLVVPIVLGLAAGQTCGKLVLYEAARRGSARFRAGSTLRRLADGRWSRRIAAALTRRRTAVPLLLVSSGVGVPPLALVSVAAGAAGRHRRTFAAMCLVGRTARFAAIALPVAYAALHA